MRCVISGPYFVLGRDRQVYGLSRAKVAVLNKNTFDLGANDNDSGQRTTRFTIDALAVTFNVE